MNTVRLKLSEYKLLFDELTSIGYNLRVIKKYIK